MKKISILGTGVMGNAIAQALLSRAGKMGLGDSGIASVVETIKFQPHD